MARRDATLQLARELARSADCSTPPHRTAAGNGEGGEFPPSTDRGGTVTWMGVHWLTGTCALPSQMVIEIVSRHFENLHFEALDWGRWTYKQSAVEHSTDARILWGGQNPGTCVNLPGEACELLGTAGVLALVRELGLKLTRLDIAWDTDLFTPADVLAADEAGSSVTHSTYRKWMNERGKKNSGSTFYIGRRGSDSDVRLVRFYDRRGPTRVEMELHGKRAQMLWSVLDGAELEDWSQGCLAYLVDFVDFRDRTQDKNVGRCDRLPWWEDFTEGAGRLALPLPRKAPTLTSTQRWLEDQVAPALSLVADSVPDATKWLKWMLKDGKDRRRKHHTAMLNAVQVASSRIT